MKTTKFFFLILTFLLFHHLQAQEMQCGTIVTDEQRNQIIRHIREHQAKSRNQNNCEDLEWSGGDQRYRLILEYAGAYTSIERMNEMVENIQNFYNPYGIYFEITLLNNPCTNCEGPFDIG